MTLYCFTALLLLLNAVQEHRTQKANRIEALSKLRSMVTDALTPPKEREMQEGISEITKANRRSDKRFRSKVKQNRGSVRNSGDW
jgi:protein subunit release factor A